MKLRRATAACVLLAAVTGCGSVGSDEDQIREAYRDMRRAIADGDGKRFCELMTIEVRQSLGASGARAGVDGGCPAVVEKKLHDRGDPESSPGPTVKRVTITGDTARAAIGLGSIGDDIGDDIDTVWMRKVSGEWLVDADPHEVVPRRLEGPPIPEAP